MKNIWNFYKGTLVLTVRGSTAYYCWVASLLALMVVGALTYMVQLNLMKDRGVLASRREGARVYYRIANPNVIRVLGCVYDHCESGKGARK